MKIFYVLTRADEWGGAQVHVREMACALARAGHEVAVAAGAAGHAASWLDSAGIPFVHLKWLKRSIRPVADLIAVLELRRIICKLKPDIVCLHSSKAGYVGRLASRLAKVPAVFTAHGWAFAEGVGQTRQRVYRILERWARPLAARVITVSEYDKRLAIQFGVGRTEDFVTIHNGMPDIRSAVDRRPPGSPVRLIMVARFSPPKSQEQVIQALALIKEKDWQLQLIGEGEGRVPCEQLAESLGLNNRMIFSGQVDDVAQRLAKSDIFVLASNWEGLPISIIEAMRAALPVVASDVGGIGELVRDGENGYLIPCGDVATLSKRLVSLIEDFRLRQHMGEASRRRFGAEFTFDQMYKRTCAVYKEVIATNA